MVAANQISFGNDRTGFLCADLAIDPLPDADLCLVRQVLQHLSNAEIQAVLENISHYKYALISEHVPKSPKSFNRDKPHGPDVRAYCGSGVYLEKPPFSRVITVAWEDELDQDSSMRTVLIYKVAILVTVTVKPGVPDTVAARPLETWALARGGPLAEQKRVRELLAQSRELLKQMQAS